MRYCANCEHLINKRYTLEMKYNKCVHADILKHDIYEDIECDWWELRK